MASVIRSNSAAQNCSPVVFSFEDAAGQADRYLDESQAQATVIIAEAQRQADEIRRRAQQAGHEAALLAAAQQNDQKIAQQMQSLLPALQKTIDGLIDVRQAWLRQWEQTAVHLSAKIAERIIRCELSHSPEITVDQVRAALQLAAGSPRLRILLHPDDFAALGNQIDRLVKEIARAAEVEIIPDITVSLGGCRVETHQGLIDQQIETQLQRIVTELTGGNE
jgi:flagellar biosynthesis/type III secretory pathway protein FliH